MLFLGIDLGSSGCKASVFDETGALQFAAARDYAFIREANGRGELDPSVVRAAALETLSELGHTYDLSDLKTVSAASFGEMFVCLDACGEPLGNSISYGDRRGTEQAAILEEKVGADRLYAITGATAHGMFALPKLLWIKEHEPQRYEKTVRIQLFADFLLTSLGAEPHTDYSLAARTLCFDVVKKAWSKDILDAVGVSPKLFQKPVAPGTPVGTLNDSLAKRLGFPQGVLLLAGAHDQVAAAIGVGALRPGTVLDGMGSNECLTPCFDRPLINPVMQASNLVCVPHAVENCYVTYAYNATAGSAWAWYQGLAKQSYEELLRDLPDAPTGLYFVPHMDGAATPYMDPAAKGAFLGLSLATDRKMLTKAVLEGLNYEIGINLDRLRHAGFEIGALYAAGGMAQSDAVLQLKADMLGVPVYRCGVKECGAKGLCLGGYVAMGLDSTLSDAALRVSAVGKKFEPNAAVYAAYETHKKVYEQLYPALRSVMNDDGKR